MTTSRTLAALARALGAVTLLATAAAAQQQPPASGTKVAKEPAMQHGADHAMSGWKELDAFHMLMMQTWHPASRTPGDLAPARARAGAMADAARAWADAAVPAPCDKPEIRTTIAGLATDSRALADLAARPATTDAELKAALKALHDRFEVVEHGCHPKGHGGGHP